MAVRDMMSGMEHPLYIYVVSARVHTPCLGPVIVFHLFHLEFAMVSPRPMIFVFTYRLGGDLGFIFVALR